MSKLQLSRADVGRLQARLQGMQSRVKNAVAKAERFVEVGLRSAEVGGTAFGLGLLKASQGDVEIVGVPLPLLASLGGHSLGFLGSGNIASHAHAIGDGALAAWSYEQGLKVGAGMKAKTSGDDDVEDDMRSYATE